MSPAKVQWIWVKRWSWSTCRQGILDIFYLYTIQKDPEDTEEGQHLWWYMKIWLTSCCHVSDNNNSCYIAETRLHERVHSWTVTCSERHNKAVKIRSQGDCVRQTHQHVNLSLSLKMRSITLRLTLLCSLPSSLLARKHLFDISRLM